MEPYLILLVIVLVSGQPQYEVQIRHTASPPIFSYLSNRENQLANGSCCVYGENPPCVSPCNQTQITVCFREAQHSRDDTDPLNCSLGGQTFNPEELNDGEVVTFSAPLTATSTRYPGSYQLYFEISALQALELIDRGHRTLNHVISDRTGGSFTSISRTGMSNVARLNLAVRVVCREGYFGPDCGCSPRNDSTGHFTCATDGTIVCFPGYQNPETNCTEEESTTQEPTTITIEITSSIVPSSSTIADVTTEITPTIDPSPTATSTTEEMDTQEVSIISTHTLVTTETSMTTTTGTLASQGALPIAVGAAVGGLVLIALLIVMLVIIGAVTVPRLKKRRKIKGEEAVVIFNMINLEDSSPNTSSDSGNTNNEVGKASIEGVNLYAEVNKEAKTPKEEAPPIVPYQGDIYTEVGETGLFVNKDDTNTLNEPQCSTTYTNVSKDSAFTAPTINEATYSTVGNGNANPEYSRLGASLVPQPQNAAVPESEPDYSKLGTVLQPQVTLPTTTYTNVSSNAFAEPEYSEVGTAKQPQEAKSTEGYTNTKESGYSEKPSYSEITEAKQTPQLTAPTSESTYTNVSSDVFAEPEYSEVDTAKQPQEAKSIEGDGKDTEEPGYSEIEGEQSGYSEIAEASQSPQAVYADVNISPTSQDGTVSTKDGKTYANTNTLDVQYAHIQNEQS